MKKPKPSPLLELMDDGVNPALIYAVGAVVVAALIFIVIAFD